MSVSVNVQGIVDQMVENMSADDVQINARKAVSTQFEDIVLNAVNKHRAAIRELTDEDNGATVNAVAISYHEKRISYYMS